VLAWIAVFLVFGLLTVRFYPPVQYNIGDEIWSVESSLEAVRNGMPSQLVAPKLYFFSLGYFLLLTGGGVFAARVFVLLAASCVLYVTYLLGREMKDELTGLASSVLLGSTFAFSWHSRVVRHEMLTSFVILLAFLAYVRGKGRFLLYGGFLAALSIHVHPNNLQYVLGLLPLYLVLFRKRVLGASTFYLIFGLMAGFVLWLVVSYLPSLGPSSGAEGVSVGGLVGVLPTPLKEKGFFELFREVVFSLPGDFFEYIRLFNIYFPNRIDIAVVIAAGSLACMLSVFTKERWKALLLFFFVFMASFVNYFITGTFGYWHVVEFYPFVAVAVALGICGIAGKMGVKAGRAFTLSCVLFFVSIGTADTVLTMGDMKDYDYRRLLRKVSEEVDGRVLGMGLYAPAFDREDFVSGWFNIDRPSSDCPPFGRRVEELGVKYIIADDLFQSFGRMGCGAEYEKDIVRYLFTRCERVAVIDEKYPSYWAKDGMISEIYIFKTPG
jgi:hypothetical protein